MTNDEKERLQAILRSLAYWLTQWDPVQRDSLFARIGRLFDEPEKKTEMTAKELVERLEALVDTGEYCPTYCIYDILKRMREEAGL